MRFSCVLEQFWMEFRWKADQQNTTRHIVIVTIPIIPSLSRFLEDTQSLEHVLSIDTSWRPTYHDPFVMRVLDHVDISSL